MVEKLIAKIIRFAELKHNVPIIYWYRYFSLVVSSIFYLAFYSENSFVIKIIIIGCVTINSVLMNSLYFKNRKNKAVILFLVSVDVMGNILLLLPTGGFSSPYIWYSFNTILITIKYLNIYYCILNLVIYIVCSSEVYPLIIHGRFLSVREILNTNYNFILAYILMFVASYQLFALTDILAEERRKLLKTNSGLSSANSKIKELVEIMMSLYRTVNYLNSEKGNKIKAAQIISGFIKKTTGSRNIFLYMKEGNIHILESDESEAVKSHMEIELKEALINTKRIHKIMILNIYNKKFITSSINSSGKDYGILGFEVTNAISNGELKEILLQVKFLSELSSLIFERMALEEINNRLIISDDQNRIANEIHDGVCQKLFGVSCSIHGIKKRLRFDNDEETLKDFENMSALLTSSIKELRETIYGLSWHKGAESSFIVDIKNYINEVYKACSIDIDFDISGNHEYISLNTKKVIYRLICEGTSNAVRHSQCSKIYIMFNIQKEKSEIVISDDGKGFNPEVQVTNKTGGLGLRNISNMVRLNDGEINIKSCSGKGTTLKAVLPNCAVNMGG